MNVMNRPKRFRQVGLAVLAVVVLTLRGASAAESQPRADFEIRDPFVLVDGGRYWLYESKPWYGGAGVDVRVSDDLENWSPKKRVMDVPEGVPRTAVWAPEVHRYRDAYYLFVTITEERGSRPIAAMAADVKPERLQPRGTWVFRAASPKGPFLPVRNGPLTPSDCMALDGTLLVEDGVPHMVYCHEWCQKGNGTIEYAPLTDDLSAFAGEPKTLLDAKSACPGAGFVTDGPFFHRSEKSGRLYLIWSNGVAGNGYCVLVRSSASGKLAGPWTKDRILCGKDGGHGMIFKALDGRLLLTIHQPNKTPDERMRLFELEDDGQDLRLRGEPGDSSSVATVPFKRLNGLCNTLTLKNDFNRVDGVDDGGLLRREGRRIFRGVADGCATAGGEDGVGGAGTICCGWLVVRGWMDRDEASLRQPGVSREPQMVIRERSDAKLPNVIDAVDLYLACLTQNERIRA